MSPLKFDVHVRTGDGVIVPFGEGAFLITIEAKDHRRAKLDADELFVEPVVVLPHRTPNAKLERALAALKDRPKHRVTNRDFRRRATTAATTGRKSSAPKPTVRFP